jgi:enoyl-CoA hydratase
VLTNDLTDATPIVDDEAVGVRFEQQEQVGILTLSRPGKLNAIDFDLYRALAAAYYRISARDDIRVLVIEGDGGAFCAGGDISFMKQMYNDEIDKHVVQDLALRYFRELVSMPQPTIAIVDGPAVGFGATTALSCDIIFASERARFADPHVQVGLVAGDGGALLWSMRVGPAKAKEYLFTGDAVHAAEAERIGLVNHVYPVEEVRDRALTFAHRLAGGPFHAIRATKSLLNHGLRTAGEEVIRCSLTMELVSQTTDYHHEAVRRFLDGDPIRF